MQTLLPVLLALSLAAGVSGAAAKAEERAGRVYPKVEAAFELPGLKGNPFDFTENDVKVTFAGPGGAEVTLPAYFDGGQTWRVRHTPPAPGKHVIKSVTLNGQPVEPAGLNARDFEVGPDSPRPGFVRIDPANKMRFVLDDGSPYYPVGYNLPWRHTGRPPMPPLVESLRRMGKTGVNWTRIWMNHWDGKNLDWFEDEALQPPLGQLGLPAAKLWDELVAAAEENGIRLQMVLQHHGQYSTKANPNWQDHPWSKANGGWLERPEQFFSDPKAIALTKAKFRYIIARWGYSPAVMAWELFNEVEYTDAFEKDLPAVAAWHAEMAKFIREHDAYKHLVTTSGRVTERSIWPAMDYYQAHVYPPDVISAVAALDAEQLDRAYFYGEVGGTVSGEQVNAGEFLHRALWASLMSRSSGAAQYWYWYVVEPQDLDFHFTAAQKFVAESGFLQHADLKPIDAAATTPERVALRFGPGTGWAPAKQTTYTVKPSGLVEGLGGMSAYLQGDHPKNREMFPFAEFRVNYPRPGTFAVRVDETKQEGARLEVSVDGRPAAVLDLVPNRPPTSRPVGPGERRRESRNVQIEAALEVPVPAGEHTIRLENNGPDWVHLREFTLTPYTSELAVLGKGNDRFAMLWLHRRATADGGDRPPVIGELRVPGLRDGAYRVVWWDTHSGTRLREDAATVSGAKALSVRTPPVERDLGAWIESATRGSE